MSDNGYMNDMGGNSATGITLTGFVVGAIFGAGLALLLAPAPGSETRRKVGETARKLGDAASEAVSRVRQRDFGGRESEGGLRGGQEGESFRSGGRREPLAGARMPHSAAPGTTT